MAAKSKDRETGRDIEWTGAKWIFSDTGEDIPVSMPAIRQHIAELERRQQRWIIVKIVGWILVIFVIFGLAAVNSIMRHRLEIKGRIAALEEFHKPNARLCKKPDCYPTIAAAVKASESGTTGSVSIYEVRAECDGIIHKEKAEFVQLVPQADFDALTSRVATLEADLEFVLNIIYRNLKIETKINNAQADLDKLQDDKFDQLERFVFEPEPKIKIYDGWTTHAVSANTVIWLNTRTRYRYLMEAK